MNIASLREECISNQKPPEMQRGDTAAEGRFFRNLKRKHVSKRYADDNDDKPRYGYKLTKQHRRDAQKQPGGFSVNLVSCAGSPECSIAMQPEPEEYHHVARIDLEGLNKLKTLTSRFLAQYEPVEKHQNFCHFELIPENGTTIKFMELFDVLEFEGGSRQQKLPDSETARKQAERESHEYGRIVHIHRWVRPRADATPKESNRPM